MTVVTPPYVSPLGHAFVASAKHFGYDVVDVNGPSLTGFTIPQGTLRAGRRCSSAKAFLLPAKSRPNLHVIGFTFVTKVILDNYKRAVGVQFDRFGVSYLVYARKEIILSAGSINTPQLLMLSGIGPANHLRKLGVSVQILVYSSRIWSEVPNFSLKFQKFSLRFCA